MEWLKDSRLIFWYKDHQLEGFGFNETFAPVAKMSTMRTFLLVVVIKGWELHQLDVNNAFLHGDLEEDFYMHLLFDFLRVLLRKFSSCVCPLMDFCKHLISDLLASFYAQFIWVCGVICELLFTHISQRSNVLYPSGVCWWYYSYWK